MTAPRIPWADREPHANIVAHTQSALLALELGLVPTFPRETADADAPTPIFTDLLYEYVMDELGEARS